MITDQRYLTDISSIVRFPTLDGTAVVYQAEEIGRAHV